MAIQQFYPPPKTFIPPKTYFWLRPCWIHADDDPDYHQNVSLGPYPFKKFRQNPFTTFSVSRWTDRQTDRQTDKQTEVKTQPPYVEVISYMSQA